MKRERGSVIERVPLTEETADVAFVVEAAREVTRRELIVNAGRLVVRDLVPQSDKKLKIALRECVQRAGWIAEATAEIPVLEGTGLYSVELATLGLLLVVPVLDAFAPVVRVEQVRPSDRHEYDERLGLECREGVVEGLDGVECCLA